MSSASTSVTQERGTAINGLTKNVVSTAGHCVHGGGGKGGIKHEPDKETLLAYIGRNNYYLPGDLASSSWFAFTASHSSAGLSSINASTCR